jgi:hypothetical protein
MNHVPNTPVTAILSDDLQEEVADTGPEEAVGAPALTGWRTSSLRHVWQVSPEQAESQPQLTPDSAYW